MKTSKHNMLIIVIVILANNFIWFYLSDKKNPRNTVTSLITERSNKNCVVNPVITDNMLKLNPEKTITSTSLKNTDKKSHKRTRISANDTISPLSAMTMTDTSIDIPMEKSQFYLNEHNNNKKYFEYANTEKKLDIIESLVAHGNDLQLIQKILNHENSNEIKIKALSRLNNEHSFATTNTLINSLDDPEEEVALMALNTIIINGDRSLLPLLYKKMDLVANQNTRNAYKKSIQRLEYSARMSMDEIRLK